MNEQMHVKTHSGDAIKFVAMIKGEIVRRERIYKTKWNKISVILSVFAILCSVIIPIIVVYIKK